VILRDSLKPVIAAAAADMRILPETAWNQPAEKLWNILTRADYQYVGGMTQFYKGFPAAAQQKHYTNSEKKPQALHAFHNHCTMVFELV
jgi:hypothetical protein